MAHLLGVLMHEVGWEVRSALVTKEAVMGTTKAVLIGEPQAMYGLYGCMELAHLQSSMFVLNAVATLLTKHSPTKTTQEKPHERKVHVPPNQAPT